MRTWDFDLLACNQQQSESSVNSIVIYITDVSLHIVSTAESVQLSYTNRNVVYLT